MQAKAALAAALTLALAAPVGASAAVHNEIGDAGDLLASSQGAVGSGTLSQIVGTMPDDQDVDLYRICVNSPADFAASTSGTIIDPQLFVFDAQGFGVVANDDIVSGQQRQARITAGSAHAPTGTGVHYLAVSRWNNDALSPGGRIFPDGTAIAGQIVGPTGAGGAQSLTGWTGQGDGANEDGGINYTIATAGTAFCLTYDGFFAPVNNGVVNAARAGQSIPVRWRLTDAAGNPISDLASFVSISSQSAAGDCAGLPSDAIETYSGTSGLQYLGDGEWQFNWKTPKSYAGQCRSMTLTLSDGTAHTASFQFK